jgi:hypothetical protein
MFPFPDKTPEFDHRLVKILEHPLRIGFLKLLADRDTLSPGEALECLQESDLLLGRLTYHVRVLDQFGLVEAAGQPDPERGVPFRVTSSGEFALAALGYSS